MTKPDVEKSKKAAAGKAVEYVEDGMIVGLGSGSTAEYFIRRLAEKGLNVLGIPTSKRTEGLAGGLGIRLASVEEVEELDLDVDGADEIDPEFNLLKGGGGAHTLEKRVAEKSKKFIVVVDYRKMVERLGFFPVAVEVEESRKEAVIKQLAYLGGIPRIREGFITDGGNIIIDARFNIVDPRGLEDRLNSIQGVIGNGIFSKRKADVVIVGEGDKVKVIERENGRK